MSNLRDELRPLLLTPGPVPLLDPVRLAGAEQLISHRSPEFAELFRRIEARTKSMFRTDGELIILTASGTGALEAVVQNALAPGEPVLAVTNGFFGERFAEIAAVYGVDVKSLSAPWGQAVDPEELRIALRSHRGYAAVLLTLNETSTGVTNPIQALSEVVHEFAPDALIVVDGISGVGALPFEPDSWGIDIVVAASQKCLMGAPGVSLVTLSDRGVKKVERVARPRYYFDFRTYRQHSQSGFTPFTPAIGVLRQLDVALDILAHEGYEHIIARHAECGTAMREGLAGVGLELLPDPAVASNTLSCLSMPQGVDWPHLARCLRREGVVAAEGLGQISSSTFRIGHMGSVTLDDVRESVTRVGRAVADIVGAPT